MAVDLSAMLSRWYAHPVAADEAHAQLLSLQKIPGVEEELLLTRLQEVALRYWTGKSIAAEMDGLKVVFSDPVEHALIDLVYGQLLISTKSSGAMEYLHSGFRQAAHFFPAKDYLEVMRRHERLQHLVLQETPMQALSLEELLKEADVVHQLEKNRGKSVRAGHDKDDMTG